MLVFAWVSSCGYYACEYDIATIPASGGTITPIPGDNVSETNPSWSPDQSRLLISIASCGYYECPPSGVRIIRRDGGDPVEIISGTVIGAVWRR
jgi:hypothetical protein